MRSLLILLSALFLIACTPQKRLNRLLKKHPELIVRDTITVLDTFILDGSEADTIFKTMITKDTVVLREKQLTIKYFNDGKTTYLSGKCDTVIQVKEIRVPVEKVNAVTEYKSYWYDIAMRWICGVVGAFVAILMLYKFIKP